MKCECENEAVVFHESIEKITIWKNLLNEVVDDISVKIGKHIVKNWTNSVVWLFCKYL